MRKPTEPQETVHGRLLRSGCSHAKRVRVPILAGLLEAVIVGFATGLRSWDPPLARFVPSHVNWPVPLTEPSLLPVATSRGARRGMASAHGSPKAARWVGGNVGGDMSGSGGGARLGCSMCRPRIITGKNAYVDDTLFGSPARSPVRSPTAKQLGPADQQPAPKALSRAASPSKGAPAALLPAKHDVVAISKSQLERMLAKSPILTPQELEARRKAAEAAYEEEQAKARARRTLMQQQAEAAKAAAPPSEMDKIRERERLEVVVRAQAAALQERDDVKVMDQMINYAKIMAARDKQVEGKQRMRQAAHAQERAIAQDMERARQAALQDLEVGKCSAGAWLLTSRALPNQDGPTVAVAALPAPHSGPAEVGHRCAHPCDCRSGSGCGRRSSGRELWSSWTSWPSGRSSGSRRSRHGRQRARP